MSPLAALRGGMLACVRGQVPGWVSEVRLRCVRWVHPPGLVVAVLGPDGAGKSTLIRSLQTDLSDVFTETVVFHHHPSLRRRGGAPVADPHGKPPHAGWLSALKILYYVGLYTAGSLAVVRPRLARSALVLFDRYYDDLCVDPRRYRYGGPAALARAARHFIPAPDLYLVLDVTDEVALSRKQEVSRGEVQRQRAAYRRLGREIPGALILDAGAPPADVARTAAEAIAGRLHERSHSGVGTERRGADPVQWVIETLGASRVPTPAGDAPFAPPARRRTFGWIVTGDGRGYGIPLTSTRSALTLDVYNPQSARARVAKAALGLGVRAGIGRHWLRPSALPIEDLVEWLRGVLGCKVTDVAVSVGPPGRDRKMTLLIMAGEDHRIAYAKIGATPTTDALVRNEAAVLAQLSGRRFQTFEIPAVLHAGPWNGRWVCVQSAPKSATRPAAPALSGMHLAIVSELAGIHTAWGRVHDSEFWRDLQTRAAQLSGSHYRRVLERGMRAAEAWLGAAPLPFHFSHGDFAPWNMKRGRERCFVFDWEYACAAAAPGQDLFYFVHQTQRRLHGRHPHQILKTFLGEGPARSAIQSHFARLGAAALPFDLLLLLYYLAALVRLAGEAESAAEVNGVQPELRALANIIATADEWIRSRPGRLTS